ncbi:MAG: DUF983 domain-containing protein [Pseudomonadota bacterium]
MTSETEKPEQRLSPFETGFYGKCPRCGAGDLFEGFLTVRPQCRACGLDYSFADSGDGPAFFIICFACIIGFGFVLWMHFSVGAPLWLNAILSLVLLTIVCLAPLRPLKGLMIAQQYFKDAHEGELVHRQDTNNI